jgi:thiosulfate/3-mercaptopyruvate sulfurtransferase
MPTDGYAQPDLLVETEWLAERLDDPNLRLVDCDPLDVYRRAHIPGAIGIPVHHYIKQPEYAKDPKQYPLVAPPDTMKELMERLGIGDENLVVAYDSNGSLWAARLWWVLNYYGHTNVKVLNGGWKKWFDEGRPVSIDRPAAAAATFTPRANAALLCTLDYGVAHVGNDEVVFLDVRSDGEWEGTNDRGNKRAGRIPGAVHLEWLNFVTADRHQTIKPAPELRAMLQAVGVTPDKEVVIY